MPLEKKYLIVAVRAESPEITVLELIDQSSKPPVMKTGVFRLGIDEYDSLGLPPVRGTLKITIEVEKPS